MIKPLSEVVEGDPVLVREFRRPWERAVVTRRTATQIQVGGHAYRMSKFDLNYARTADKLYTRSMQAFDQCVLDEQAAKADLATRMKSALDRADAARLRVNRAYSAMRDPLHVVSVAIELEKIADTLEASK